MKDFTTYLIFDGNAGEAMTFYQSCFDAQLDMQNFSAGPCPVPPGAENRIMHARLTKGPIVLMASDTMPGMPFQSGNNFSIAVHCETMDETQKLFTTLSEGGNVTMPLQDTFWGAHFGMLTDKFGVNWMLNLDKDSGTQS
ncbi:MAG TPA: VOC family protein [Bryobacteraceae bacterium]|nr:VOC family protein [Bryobacteraceae bacterium]